MSAYRVREDTTQSVSHKKRVYGPGETLPDDLSEEAVEQLLKNGAIEKLTAKDKSEAEQKAAEDGPVHEKTPKDENPPATTKKTTETSTPSGQTKSATTPQVKPPAK